MRIPACIWLCPEDRTRLEWLVADRNTSRKVVWRSRIVLLSAEGHGTCEIVIAHLGSSGWLNGWYFRQPDTQMLIFLDRGTRT